MSQTTIVSLSKVLTNGVNTYPFHSVWHICQIPSQSILISSVTSLFTSNKLFKPEKKHTSNQTHHLHLQNGSPFSGLLCYYLQTWVEPPFLSSLYYLNLKQSLSFWAVIIIYKALGFYWHLRTIRFRFFNAIVKFYHWSTTISHRVKSARAVPTWKPAVSRQPRPLMLKLPIDIAI